MNKAGVLSLTILSLLFTAIFSLRFMASVKANPNIIHVPSDYMKIQWAVGNASAGDTIIVGAGIYQEWVTIDKSLTIKGENGNTIIDGNGTGHVVRIFADNVSVSGFTIQNSGSEVGCSAVYMGNSSWCNINHNILRNSGEGIWINYYSSNNVIFENNVSYNKVGIDLDVSNNNTIMNNYIFSSVYCGIGLSNSNNSILTNNVAKSNEYGIWLDYSTDVTIARNTIIDNLHGIHLNYADNNTIFNNNFINNTQQTEIINSVSVWNADSEGNYWSDYNGLDANHDGIGDSPRTIDAGNEDHYPLMGTFSDFTINWDEKLHHVTTICNSTISDFQFNGTAINFNVTGEDETAGFCRIRIPTTLINNAFTVYVDGVNTTYTLLPRSNATYSYLYFTYAHSTKEVIIIPEFPSTLLSYLLMTLTLAATAYSKRALLSEMKNKNYRKNG